MNEKALDFFKRVVQNTEDEFSVKLDKSNDNSELDAEFISKYINIESELLDLGAGTGLIINRLYNKVKTITAVEPFDGFTKFIARVPQIEIINQTFDKYQTNKKFDIITSFGVMHYFNEEEAKLIYAKYIHNIKENGIIIIKNQFGVNEDVRVSGFSKAIGQDYFSEYRHIKKETKLLEDTGYSILEIVDIYPPSCNHWDNTHYYAIVAKRKY